MTLPELAHLSAVGGVAFFDPFALHARLDFNFHDRDAATNGPVLVHEYTHYLQSVSTIYGLYRVLDWIRTGVRLAHVLPPITSIRVPLRSWWRRGDCPPALRTQMAEIDERLALNIDLEQPEPLDDAGIESFGPLQIAHVKLSDGERHIMAVARMSDGTIIPVGARALAEGMAASVQRMWEASPHLDTTLSQLEPQVAGWYQATRNILRELLESEDDLDFINALVCDASMMTRNPGASFIAITATIAGRHVKTKPDVFGAVREAFQETIDEELAYTRADIADTLGRLGDEEPFARGVRRLLTSFIELLARRLEQPGFPIDILCGDRPAELEPLLLQYPLPCYFSGSRLLAWHDDENLGRLGEQLLMMEHAMRILLFGPRTGRECPLTTSSSCHATKSALCGTAPWRIGADADGMLCGFSAAMAAFGALGKVTS